MASDGQVLLGYISGGTGHMEWFDSMFSAACSPSHSKSIGGVISATSGPLIAYARNLLVQQFLDSPLDWLCSIDTDIMFRPDAIDRLFRSADVEERPIISALYHIFDQGDVIPAAYLNEGTEDEICFKVMKPVEGRGVIEVGAVGAGFLMVHRRVFEEIRKRANGERVWFRETILDGRDIGEDISFCLRATALGFPIHLDTDVQVAHIKPTMIGKAN